MKRWRWLLLLGVFCLAPAYALERVTLQLKWKHQFQFAGYYAAQAKGFYREAGLDVDILEAKPGLHVEDMVVGNEGRYGVGSAELLLKRASGSPVVVLAVIMQHSPLALMARADRVTQLQDLVGQTVMIEPGSAELYAYLRNESLSLNRLAVVSHSFDVRDFLRGRVAAQSVYISDEVYEADQAGVEYLLFRPQSAGIDFYGDNLFTSEAELKLHPARVKAFREASLKGWRYAFEHPVEVVDLILARYSTRKTRQHLLFEAERMKLLVQPDLIELGYMNPGRWEYMAKIYREMGMLTQPFSVAGFMYGGSTETVGEAAYPAWALWAAVGGCLLMLVLSLFYFHCGLYYRGLQETAERDCQSCEQRIRLMLEFLPAGLMRWDDAYRLIEWNPSLERLLGWSRQEVLGRKLTDFLIPKEKAAFWDELVANCQAGQPQVVSRLDVLRREGGVLPCRLLSAKWPLQGGFHAGGMTVVLDDHALLHAETALHESEDRFRQIVEMLPMPVVFVSLADGVILYGNRRAGEFFGLSPAEVGHHVLEFYSNPTDHSRFLDAIERDGHVSAWPITLKHPSGQIAQLRVYSVLVRRERGSIIVSCLEDMANEARRVTELEHSQTALQQQVEAARRLQEHYRQQMLFDPVTGCFSRYFLHEWLPFELERCRQLQQPLAFWLFEIDQMHVLNEAYGKAAADEVLKQTAMTLKKHLPEGAVLARFGIEELAALAVGVDHDHALDLAEVVRQVIAEQNYVLESAAVSVTVSIGVGSFAPQVWQATEVLRAMDVALHSARAAGRNRVGAAP